MLNKELDTLLIASQTEFSASQAASVPSSLRKEALRSRETRLSHTDAGCLDVPATVLQGKRISFFTPQSLMCFPKL